MFDVTRSPFCLNGVIRKHVQSYDVDKEFIDKVLSLFFVDHFIGGEESVAKATELFKKLRFRRNLITNNNSGNEDTVNKVEKILGIPWNSDKYIIVYDFKAIVKNAQKSKPTKRNLLKIVSSFYGPIRLVQPILVSLQILLQKAHRLKLGWDDSFVGKSNRFGKEI